MRALAFYVFDTIYSDTNRAASLHRLGAWIGKANWYAKAADGGGDDGAADAKPGGDGGAADANRAGEQHQHRDRGTFEGTGKNQLGGWLQSLGETKTALSQKAVIYLSNEAHRCLIAVGDEPGQQVGSIAFGIPDNPNTCWAGNEKAGDEMWRKHGDDDQPCRIVITRKHNDLWVFDDAMNGRQKIWVGGGELLACPLPQTTGSCRWGFVYIHDLHRPPGHRPR